MKAEKIALRCLECGKTFARALTRTLEPTCPKCKGSDIEPDYRAKVTVSRAPRPIPPVAYGRRLFFLGTPRCSDCGRAGETKGHMTCAYPT